MQNQQGRKAPPNPASIIKVQTYIRRRLAGLKLEKLARKSDNGFENIYSFKCANYIHIRFHLK